jgi:PKD repeat protein
MKRLILLGFLIISLSIDAQDFYTSGDCKADFIFAVNPDIQTLLPATAIDFFDKSPGDVKEWYWDFGDSITSNEQNPMIVFNHPIGGPTVKISPYRKITLTIVTVDSCKSTFSQTINIIDGTLYGQNQNCKAVFKYYESERDTLNGITTINFNNYSEGENLSYFWQFGNGTTSTEKEPVVKFDSKQSEYKVCLTVTGMDSCSNIMCDAVYIQPIPWDTTFIDPTEPECQVGFGYKMKDILMGPLPSMLVEFYYKSNPEAMQWHWDFGDGTTSNEANPTHVYTLTNQPDSIFGDSLSFYLPYPYRTICLTVVTEDTCKVSYCETIQVFGNDPLPESCKAFFKYYESERDTLNRIATIKFNNYSEGENLSYFWKFGNGITSTEKEPVVKFDSKQSEYKVCLTVTGMDSCSNIMCDAVYIQPVPWDSTYIDPNEPECQVDFGYKLKDVLMGPLPSMLVEFYYKSNPEAMQWHWDFGDGTTSNEPNPTHTYIQINQSDSIAGDSIYPAYINPYRTVCLTVVTEDTCEVSYCEIIQVFGNDPISEGCKAVFKYYQPDDIVSIPEVVPVQLVDVSEGDVISREWKFEDGTTSSEKEPLVMFSIFQPEHKVVLTVTFADSCVNTFYGKVILAPVVSDTTVVDSVCPYIIKVDGGFPIQMSSCAGWASASIYLGNEEVNPAYISWSTGDTVAKIGDLCPQRSYEVKAQMPDGCTVSTKFVLDAGGVITPISLYNWWLTGEREKIYVQSDAPLGLKVQWRLCDGTIVEADSIPLDAINCGGSVSNMIIRDLEGNMVYSENISLKGIFTGIEDLKLTPTVKLWPNPVNDKLNIRYSGDFQTEIIVEVCDVMGKRVSAKIHRNISDNHEFSINTESLKSGIYICRISAFGKIIDAQKFSRR